MPRRTKLLLLSAVAIVVISCYALLSQHRARLAQGELATILPQIATITLYDLDLSDPTDSKTLEAAISAPFPADVFTRAAASARHRDGITVWKGSSLAVITLRDGTQRRARFSYYGGFFTLDGANGRFSIPGDSSSDFHQALIQFINQHFVPRRIERNKA